MFAGAAREAVFSNPAVVAKIEAGFVPVAVKAGTVQNPPDGPEGAIYRELKRTQPAPQGICVVNSTGHVLAWSLMFEDDDSVLAFFDHAEALFRANPRAAVPAERYVRFPSAKLDDTPPGDAPLVGGGLRHTRGERCPGQLPTPPAALLGTMVGRVVPADGADTPSPRSQDNYIEERVAIPLPVQQSLADAMTQSGGRRVRVPDNFATALAGSAYLGQLDVNPLGGPQIRARTRQADLHLWVERQADNLWRLGGTSLVAGESLPGDAAGDGRQWQHRVALRWRGAITTDDSGIAEVLATAHGDERLVWKPRGLPGSAADNPVAHLPGGRPIDLDTEVRYGVALGRPPEAPRR